MREILFKAKRKDTGEWVEGYYVLSGITTASFIVPVCDCRKQFIPIEPETLCQYTGLTDKNGAKIFEGDVVIYDYEPGKGFWNVYQNSIISFRDGGFFLKGVMGTNKYACMDGWLSQLPIGNGEFFEVIGNIHDKKGVANENS